MAPGESGKISIKISSAHGGGAIAKSITVNTNVSGGDAQLVLQMKGEIWQAVTLQPASAAFGRITSTPTGTNVFRKLTIVSNVPDPLKLGTPTSSNPKFKAELTTIEPGKRFELVITVQGTLDQGNNTGNVNITTGLADPPTIVVPYYAFVTPPIDVTPSSLALAANRTAETTRQFYIRANNDKAVKLSGLKCTVPEFKLDLIDMKESKTYRLNVTIPAAYKPKAGDKITFNTDDPSTPLMTIPINEIAAPIPRPPGLVPSKGKPGVATTQGSVDARRRAAEQARAFRKQQQRQPNSVQHGKVTPAPTTQPAH